MHALTHVQFNCGKSYLFPIIRRRKWKIIFNSFFYFAEALKAHFKFLFSVAHSHDFESFIESQARALNFILKSSSDGLASLEARLGQKVYCPYTFTCMAHLKC